MKENTRIEKRTVFSLAKKKAIGDWRSLTFDNGMEEAAPPDLPLSPVKVGTSLGGSQGSDQGLEIGEGSKMVLSPMEGLEIQDAGDDKSKGLLQKDDRSKVPMMAKGSWVGAVQGQKVLKKYEVEIEMKDGIGSIVVPEEITKGVAPLWDDFPGS